MWWQKLAIACATADSSATAKRCHRLLGLARFRRAGEAHADLAQCHTGVLPLPQSGERFAQFRQRGRRNRAFGIAAKRRQIGARGIRGFANCSNA